MFLKRDVFLLKWQKFNLNLFQVLTYIYSLKKVQEAEFLTLLKDIAKKAIKL